MLNYGASSLLNFLELLMRASAITYTLDSLTVHLPEHFCLFTNAASFIEKLTPCINGHFCWWFHTKLKFPSICNIRFWLSIPELMVSLLHLRLFSTTMELAPMIVKLGNWSSIIPKLDHITLPKCVYFSFLCFSVHEQCYSCSPSTIWNTISSITKLVILYCKGKDTFLG